MSLSEDLKKKKYDVRLLDWNLNNNLITQAEYDKYIQDLEDQGSNSEYLDITSDNNQASDGATLEH